MHTRRWFQLSTWLETEGFAFPDGFGNDNTELDLKAWDSNARSVTFPIGPRAAFMQENPNADADSWYRIFRIYFDGFGIHFCTQKKKRTIHLWIRDIVFITHSNRTFLLEAFSSVICIWGHLSGFFHVPMGENEIGRILWMPENTIFVNRGWRKNLKYKTRIQIWPTCSLDRRGIACWSSQVSSFQDDYRGFQLKYNISIKRYRRRYFRWGFLPWGYC